MKLFPHPLHLCLCIIPKCQSAFPLAPWLPLLRRAPLHTRTRQPAQEIRTQTHTHTHVTNTQAHKSNERERKRDPKHQNSINPPRRSLKGFLKADFHHTEAFQVNTVCGGNGAEAFKLCALTFPLCYSLFLHLARTVSLFSQFPSLRFLFCPRLSGILKQSVRTEVAANVVCVFKSNDRHGFPVL